MEFHRIPAEKLRDQIFKIMIEKDLVKEGLTLDDLREHISFDDNDNIESECDEQIESNNIKMEVFTDNIQDSDNNNQEQNQEQ